MIHKEIDLLPDGDTLLSADAIAFIELSTRTYVWSIEEA
jgi:hypothetical protein